MATRHDMIPWTAEREAALRDSWHVLSTSQIAEILHRTPKAIEIKASRMGLPQKGYDERIYMHKTGRPMKKSLKHDRDELFSAVLDLDDDEIVLACESLLEVLGLYKNGQVDNIIKYYKKRGHLTESETSYLLNWIATKGLDATAH